MFIHPVPDIHIDEGDAGDLTGVPEIVERLERVAARFGLCQAEHLQVARLKHEGQGLGKRCIGDSRQKGVVHFVE